MGYAFSKKYYKFSSNTMKIRFNHVNVLATYRHSLTVLCMNDLSFDETVSLSRKRGVESRKWEATRAWFYSKHEAAIKLFADATSGILFQTWLSNYLILSVKLSHSLVTYQLKNKFTSVRQVWIRIQPLTP